MNIFNHIDNYLPTNYQLKQSYKYTLSEVQ